MTSNGAGEIETKGRECAVCGRPATRGGWGGGGSLCNEDYQKWTVAKESIRFNEHYEAGRPDAARVSFEDFVRRARAERLHRAA